MPRAEASVGRFVVEPQAVRVGVETRDQLIARRLLRHAESTQGRNFVLVLFGRDQVVLCGPLVPQDTAIRKDGGIPDWRHTARRWICSCKRVCDRKRENANDSNCVQETGSVGQGTHG